MCIVGNCVKFCDTKSTIGTICQEQHWGGIKTYLLLFVKEQHVSCLEVIQQARFKHGATRHRTEDDIMKVEIFKRVHPCLSESSNRRLNKFKQNKLGGDQS